MICHFAGKTCGACCWGESVDRETLSRKLRRQERLFQGYRSRAVVPGAGGLFLHELRARRAKDLLMAPFLLLPWLGPWLRVRLGRRMVCAFVAFLDDGTERIGCLLHPSQWRDADVRRRAFAILPGFRCGPPEFFCEGAQRFALSTPLVQARFLRETRDMSWLDYSAAAPAFEPFEI